MGESDVDFSDGTEGGGLVVDFNDVEDDKGFEAVPRGKYNCAVSDLTFDISQSSGNPMWTWVLEVEDGDYAGRKFFFHTVFQGKGLPRTKKTIGRVAPELLDAPFNPEEVASQGTLMGRRVVASVDVRPYQGEQRNNVKDIFAATEGGDASFM